MMNWFKKWKLVDTTKYSVESKYKRGRFQLTKKQLKEIDKIIEEKGTVEYTFYPYGGRYGVKVKVWKTGEYIDVTNVDS